MSPIHYPVSLPSACSCHHCSHQSRWVTISKVSHPRAPEICVFQRIHDESKTHIQKGHHWKTATFTLVFNKCSSWLVSKSHQFVIPCLCINISTGKRMVIQTSDTEPLQKSISGKVGNQEKSSVSPRGGLQSDSNSKAFSDMLKKIRIIHEKCPKCLLLHRQKIVTSSFNEIQDYKETKYIAALTGSSLDQISF